MASVRWLLSRYGEAIERDLPFYYPGVDLFDLWRGRLTPRRLVLLVEGLPPNSMFGEASAQDIEVARMWAAAHDIDEAPQPPRWRDWSPERAELVGIHEAIRELTVAMTGGGRRPPALDRPLSAYEAVKREFADAAVESLLGKIEAARSAS